MMKRLQPTQGLREERQRKQQVESAEVGMNLARSRHEKVSIAGV